MSQTGKTVLIAGGVVVGAYVLMKFLAPPPAVNRGATSSTSGLAGIIGNVAALGSGIANLFGKSSPTSSASSSFDAGAYSDAATQATLRNFDSRNFTVTNGFMFTDDNGNFIAG